MAERRFDGVRIPVIYIDGVVYAGETMTVALGVLENGAKRVLGVRQGATENAAVCTALMEDLQERGLDTSQPTLLVLDGSKALHAAVKRVWGRNALIQRCQVHKKRNVREHLPEKHWDELSRQLHAAYNETDYDEALRAIEDDGPLAGAAEPRRRGEPAGRDGGNADGDSSGRSRVASPDVGDDQSDRVGLQRGRRT